MFSPMDRISPHIIASFTLQDGSSEVVSPSDATIERNKVLVASAEEWMQISEERLRSSVNS